VGALAVSAAALLGITGCDTSETADVERGRALFQQQCGRCHGLAEAGTPDGVGPNLDAAFAEARRDGGFDEDTYEGVVQDQIANPRQVDEGAADYENVYMPADLVTGQDAEDVATYVASVAGVPGAQPPEITSPQTFFTESCGSCHTLSAAGTSGAVGPNLDEALPGQKPEQVAESIRDPAATIAQGFQNQMPPFTETRLPEDDLQSLVQYLLESVGAGS
jgi:cbb3-type cytochrome c oxidase subunit III